MFLYHFICTYHDNERDKSSRLFKTQRFNKRQRFSRRDGKAGLCGLLKTIRGASEVVEKILSIVNDALKMYSDLRKKLSDSNSDGSSASSGSLGSNSDVPSVPSCRRLLSLHRRRSLDSRLVNFPSSTIGKRRDSKKKELLSMTEIFSESSLLKETRNLSQNSTTRSNRRKRLFGNSFNPEILL